VGLNITILPGHLVKGDWLCGWLMYRKWSIHWW